MFLLFLYFGGIYIKGKRKINKSKFINYFKKSKIFIKIYMNILKCLCIIMFMNFFGGLIWLYFFKYVVIVWELYIFLNVVIENLYVIYILMVRNKIIRSIFSMIIIFCFKYSIF